jgi:hypothetical protein
MFRTAKIILCCLLPGITAGAPSLNVQKTIEEFVTSKKYNTSGTAIVFKEVGSNKPR